MNINYIQYQLQYQTEVAAVEVATTEMAARKVAEEMTEVTATELTAMEAVVAEMATYSGTVTVAVEDHNTVDHSCTCS